MRVLITTPSGIGHVHPMVPLARALLRCGHEVLWAAPPDAAGRIESAGVRTTPAGRPARECTADFWGRHPELRSLPPAELPDQMFPRMFGGVAAPAMLDDLAPVALDWRPDLVVADAAELAGPIVAAELGVPGVTKSFGALLPARRLAAAAEVVAPLWRSRGLEPRPYAGCYDHLYLDIYPPASSRRRPTASRVASCCARSPMTASAGGPPLIRSSRIGRGARSCTSLSAPCSTVPSRSIGRSPPSPRFTSVCW